MRILPSRSQNSASVIAPGQNRFKRLFQSPFTIPDRAGPGWTGLDRITHLVCHPTRLAGQTIETGAFARQVVDGHALALDLAGQGSSVFARVVGRLLEIARTQLLLEQWADAITPEARFLDQVAIPQEGSGEGLVEAARGSLGHWLRIEGGKIASYQIIAPTTWNFSPRDADDGVPGPLEAALVGAKVAEGEDTPLSVQHIVRSFDPCMVCTVH